MVPSLAWADILSYGTGGGIPRRRMQVVLMRAISLGRSVAFSAAAVDLSLNSFVQIKS